MGDPPGQGTPPARVTPPASGTPPGQLYPPSQGTPPARCTPRWPGYPPSQGTPPAIVVPPQPGYPISSQGTPPGLDLAGYPIHLWAVTTGRVPPPAAPWHSGKSLQSIDGITGTPPPCGQTDMMDGQTTCQNITLANVLIVTRAVIKIKNHCQAFSCTPSRPYAFDCM